MAFEHRDWPTGDDDDDRTDSDRDDEQLDKDGWTSESRCSECKYTKGHRPGCPNA